MSEWIPVSDRLPRNYTDVLVTADDGEQYMAFKNPDDTFYFYEELYIDGAQVVAWKPLPEPHREDERGDERVGALIDVIEDFLAERGVRLPESVEDDTVCGGAVVIYGGDYDALASRIKEFFGDGHEL